MFAQSVMQVTPTQSVQQLVLGEFIKENECLEVFNIKAIGTQNTLGTFSGGQNIIATENGVVFSTGFLGTIGQPNISTQTTGQLYGPADAPYLSQAIRSTRIFDAVGIEFDFIPTQRVVSFNYVFASEEYCEYVNSQFNDAFGFFISGPGIQGDGFNNSLNIARIPESNSIVTINTVNHIRNTDFFVNNLTLVDAANCGIPFEPQSPSSIEFDGFTKRLQSVIEVIPCETYRLRLVVGDVSDDALDSAVFLEGNSFEISDIGSVEANVRESSGLTVYENCLEGEFVFLRNRLLEEDGEVLINYTIGGTATMGDDFEVIPDSILIAANSIQTRIPINVIPDDIVEGRESIEIVIESITCECIQRDTAILFIEDAKDFIGVNFDETSVCVGQEFTFGPEVEAAIEPVRYLWNTGETTATISDTILSSQSYQVTVSDFCGATDSARIAVQIQDIPELRIEGNFDFCTGRQPEELLLDLPGQAPWTINYSIDNEESVLLENIVTNPFPLRFEQAGRYQFLSFSDEFCTGNIQGEVLVEALDFDFDYNSIPPSCPNADDGSITLDIRAGVEPITIDWGLENEIQATLTGLSAGNYNVMVMDGLGCILRDSIEVLPAVASEKCQIDVASNLYIPNAFSPNGDGINDLFTVYPTYELIERVSYKIYDRWGGLRFQSNNFGQGESEAFWDGGELDTGIYLCVVELGLVDGSSEFVGQEVFLVR